MDQTRRRWGQCNGNSCPRASEAAAAADPDSIELTCVPPLPQDLEQHIRECQCSCDHLGFGNFKTITYVDGQHWDNVDVIDVKPSASTVDILHGDLPGSASPCSPERHRSIEKKEAGRGAEIGRRHWCVVCMILVVVAATGLISVPLLLRDMARGTSQHRLQLARKILSQVPLVDGHNDFPWNARRFIYNKLKSVNLTSDLRNVRPWNESVWSHTDLFRLRQGMVGAQFWSIYVPCGAQYLDAVQIALEQIDTVRRMVDRYPSHTALAGSAQEIVEIHSGGRMASLLGVEGGHAIASSLPVLRSLHALGARYLTLTHTCSTPWSEYSEVPSLAQRGLTEIGESVVREMNRLGMLVDLSHSSTQTMRDVLAVSRAPTMFSHSSAHALCNISRNVPDAILKQLALHDGIVMVSFYNRFLTCGENATISDVIAHIEHIRRVAGVDHIGLGAGYDGIDLVPEGLQDPSTYPRLVADLLGRPGWSEADVRKVVGLNFLRVLRKVEQTRDRLSMEEPISLEPLHVIDQNYINNNCTYDLRLK